MLDSAGFVIMISTHRDRVLKQINNISKYEEVKK